MNGGSQLPGTFGRRPARARIRGGTLIVFLSLLIALPGAGAWGQADTTPRQTTPEEMAAAIVRPSVVYLDVYWSTNVQDHDGDWFSYEYTTSCTGFVVNPGGYIATAGHCVDPGLEGGGGIALGYAIDEWIMNGWATEADRPQLSEIAYANWKLEGAAAGSPPDRSVYVQHGAATSGLRTGQAWTARVVEYLPVSQGDVALIKVEQANLPTVLLSQDAEVGIGTPVLSVGYPASSDWVTDATYEPTYKDGKISSKKTREGGMLPVYEISAAVSPGMSGGPTVDTDGDVVGVNSFGIVGETQQFNFLSPVGLVSEMLARNGVSNELGPIDEAYRKAIASYMAGNYSQAMQEFDLVLDRSPSHQQAQEFRALAAQQAPLEPPAAEETAPPATQEAAETVATESDEESGFPVVPVGIGAVALFVVVGLVFAVAQTRKRKADPGAADATPAASPPAPVTSAVQPPVASSQPPSTTEPTVVLPSDTATATRAVVPPPPTSAESPGAAPLSAPVATPTAPHFCTECGQLVSPTAKFCAACGTTLGGPLGS